MTALSNFPETQVLASDSPEDAIPWPATLAEPSESSTAWGHLKLELKSKVTSQQDPAVSRVDQGQVETTRDLT